jgi:hypothetical protein
VATAPAPHESVETLQRLLSHLVGERERMRFHAGSPSELEANRLATLVSVKGACGGSLAPVREPDKRTWIEKAETEWGKGRVRSMGRVKLSASISAVCSR